MKEGADVSAEPVEDAGSAPVDSRTSSEETEPGLELCTVEPVKQIPIACAKDTGPTLTLLLREATFLAFQLHKAKLHSHSVLGATPGSLCKIHRSHI